MRVWADQPRQRTAVEVSSGQVRSQAGRRFFRVFCSDAGREAGGCDGRRMQQQQQQQQHTEQQSRSARDAREATVRPGETRSKHLRAHEPEESKQPTAQTDQRRRRRQGRRHHRRRHHLSSERASAAAPGRRRSTHRVSFIAVQHRTEADRHLAAFLTQYEPWPNLLPPSHSFHPSA